MKLYRWLVDLIWVLKILKKWRKDWPLFIVFRSRSLNFWRCTTLLVRIFFSHFLEGFIETFDTFTSWKMKNIVLESRKHISYYAPKHASICTYIYFISDPKILLCYEWLISEYLMSFFTFLLFSDEISPWNGALCWNILFVSPVCVWGSQMLHHLAILYHVWYYSWYHNLPSRVWNRPSVVEEEIDQVSFWKI